MEEEDGMRGERQRRGGRGGGDGGRGGGRRKSRRKNSRRKSLGLGEKDEEKEREEVQGVDRQQEEEEEAEGEEGQEEEKRGFISDMAADVSHVFSQQQLWLQPTPVQPKHQGSSCFRSAFRGKHHTGDSSVLF